MTGWPRRWRAGRWMVAAWCGLVAPWPTIVAGGGVPQSQGVGHDAQLERRADLEEPLSRLLCHAGDVRLQPPSWVNLWSEGIYDADLAVHWIERTTSGGGDTSEAMTNATWANLARQGARASGHRGYAVGTCSQKVTWLATVPAQRAPILVVGQGSSVRLRLSTQDLHERCAQWTLLHADRAGRTRTRVVADSSSPSSEIDPKGLPEGVLTLRCLSADLSQGPTLLAFVPHPRDATLALPGRESLGPGGEIGLVSWLNARRRVAGLAPVRPGKSVMLEAVAKLALAGDSVAHNRPLLREVRDLLAGQGLRLLGENRAFVPEGSSVDGDWAAEAAWLFWFSASHRDLLMSESATHLSVLSRSLEEPAGRGRLVVVLAARDEGVASRDER